MEPRAKAWTQAPVGSPPPAAGRPAPKDLLPAPKRLDAIARELPTGAWRTVTWREGTAWTHARPALPAGQVWASHGYTQRQHGAERTREWLLVEWPPDKAAPTDYWLLHPGAGTKTPTLKALVGLARKRWRVEQDDRELKEELGLDHCEGRSWTGWHHHVALTCLAHLFLQGERRRRPPGPRKKNRDAPAAHESLPPTRRRLHAALVRRSCTRCPWCHTRLDTS